MASVLEPIVSAPPEMDLRRSRRSLLAAAAAGLAGLVAGALGRPSAVQAGAGDPIIIGNANTAGGTNTSLQTSDGGPTFKAINNGAGAAVRGDSADGIGGKFVTTNGPWAVEATGDSYGVLGTGVQVGVQGEGYRGVHGTTSASAASAGVSGTNTGLSDAWGVIGTVSDNGAIAGAPFGGCKGVVGKATAADGVTYGVYGEATSTAGRGVYGYATANTGTTYGVIGRVDSPDGYGGYFYHRVFTNGWYELAEIAQPAAPSANRGRLYLVDSGGSTQLRVRFGNGTIKVIATDV